jgi:hypothetical protein
MSLASCVLRKGLRGGERVRAAHNTCLTLKGLISKVAYVKPSQTFNNVADSTKTSEARFSNFSTSQKTSLSPANVTARVGTRTDVRVSKERRTSLNRKEHVGHLQTKRR